MVITYRIYLNVTIIFYKFFHYFHLHILTINTLPPIFQRFYNIDSNLLTPLILIPNSQNHQKPEPKPERDQSDTRPTIIIETRINGSRSKTQVLYSLPVWFLN